jgi:MerR family transcriptional regulator, heat shock protein HspR
MSQQPLHSREQVAAHLSVAPGVLLRYEATGLVRPTMEGAYGPAEIRRVWTILTLQRDLGINLAGVEAVLKLRAHLDLLRHRLELVTAEFEDAVEVLVEELDDE